MFRSDKIQLALFGGVGFRQSPITGYDIVDTPNQVSDSGLFFQDGSPLVTIKNIKDTQQDITADDADFNLFIKQLQEAVIIETCSKVVSGQSDFKQSANLYPFEKAFSNTITPSNRFVGFEVIPTVNIGCILRIPWIELSFDTDKTFNIHLFNSNLKAPIQTKSVTVVAGESTIVDLGWFVSDDITHKGGNFYIGYFEDDLDGARAFKKDFDNSNIQIRTRSYYINPVTINHNTEVLDVTSVIESSFVFGLNIGVDIYNDYTELIIRNKNLFWNSIQLQMADKCLRLFKSATRSNRTERITDQFKDLYLDLYGDRNIGIAGIEGKLKSSISDLRKMLFREPLISRGTLR
jgi:hypothetical protein